MTSPACSRFIAKVRMLLRRWWSSGLSSSESIDVKIGLYRGVQVIEHVVQSPCFDDQLSVASGKGVPCSSQHLVQHIDKAKGLSRRAAQCHDGRLPGRRVEVKGTRWVSRIDTAGQHPPQQLREAGQGGGRKGQPAAD